MTLVEKLQEIQSTLNVKKTLWNDFGNYAYRSAEGILEAFKPIADKLKVVLVLTDNVVQIGERYYIKAVARLYDAESEAVPIETAAWAREPEVKKGLDPSQITGSASSYARKYALSGLFLLDDNKDADADGSHDGEQITADMLQDLREKIAGVNVTEAQVVDAFNLKRIEDLTSSQYKTALKRVEATRRAANKKSVA